MDAFESIVATILEREGFWVRTSFKVKLTKEDRHAIGRKSCPRWEIDVLAYCPGDNLLWVVECKSYLDSRGVCRRGFTPGHKRLKLFNDPRLRQIVFSRLEAQLLQSETIVAGARPQLCLAAGKIVASDLPWIESQCDANGWQLLGPSWIRERLEGLRRKRTTRTSPASSSKITET